MSTNYTPPTAEGLAQENWLSRAYYWFWHDVCHRPEPFTYTMRKWCISNPILTLIIPLLIAWPLIIWFAWDAGVFDKKSKMHCWMGAIIAACIIGSGLWLLVVHLWGLI